MQLFINKERQQRQEDYLGEPIKEKLGLREGDEIKTFLSTSMEEEIARRFGDDAILIFRTEKGLPHFSPEILKDEDGKREEEEVLILPFSKVVKIEDAGKRDNRKYYGVTIEKEELPEIEPEEIQALKEFCVKGIEEFQSQMKEYINLGKELKVLYAKTKENATGDAWQRINEVQKEALPIGKKIEEYNQKFQKMLEGMCRQKEIEIDKQREEIVQDGVKIDFGHESVEML